MSELTGKVALVTGGGRGIGREVALALARRGIKVAVAARTAREINAVVSEIRLLGHEAGAFEVDLADPKAPQALVEQVAGRLGPIAILVNNAAVVGPFGATWEVDPDEWEQALQVNLVAPFRLARAVLPHMIAAGWGRIINISSGAARNPIERTGPYSLSKAGLDLLTSQLGAELEGTGVAAICIYPGVVDTAMQAAIRDQSPEVVGQNVAQRFSQVHSSGRRQSPVRPAKLIAALVEQAGDEFNGQIVDIHSEVAQQLLQGSRTSLVDGLELCGQGSSGGLGW